MSLADKINTNLKEAMKAKDEAALRALRAIKSALLLAKTEKGAEGDVNEEQEVKLLQKLAKQRKESIDIYRQQGREDLAKPEEEELKIIEKFLPEQMSEEDVRREIKAIIEQTGASQPSDLGKVMGAAMQKLGGKADGKTISAVAKELLADK